MSLSSQRPYYGDGTTPKGSVMPFVLLERLPPYALTAFVWIVFVLEVIEELI